MNIIYTLTRRQLLLNKKRTLVTLIGVILSVAMITAVPTFVTSFLAMMRMTAIENTGFWHANYVQIPVSDLEQVAKDDNVLHVALSNSIGFAKLVHCKNLDKPYLYVQAYDKQAFETFRIRLQRGRLPNNEAEIVIPAHLRTNGGITYDVGDTITLQLGQRILELGDERNVLEAHTSYVREGFMGANQTEQFVPQFTRTYKVTGIVDRPAIEPYDAAGYTALTYLDVTHLQKTDRLDVAATWKKVSNKAIKQRLHQRIGSEAKKNGLNQELLIYYFLNTSPMNTSFKDFMTTLATISIVLIMLASIALIYNSFAISMSERSRHLGMLASIGATKRQKASAVLFECFFVGIISIPLGIMVGTLGMGIVFTMIQPLITSVIDNVHVKLELVVAPGAIAVAIVVSIVTLLLSAFVPAIRAAKILPIEAIRQTRDVKLTARKVKTSKLTRLLFGFEAELGLKNLKRNKLRYRSTLLSLIASIILFLSVSFLVAIWNQSLTVARKAIPYDIQVQINSSSIPALEKRQVYDEVARLKHVDQSVIQQSVYAETLNRAGQMQEAFEIIAIDPLSWQTYTKQLGLDAATLQQKKQLQGILFDYARTELPNHTLALTRKSSYVAGKNVQLWIFPDEANADRTRIDITVAKVAKRTPIGSPTLYDSQPYPTMYVSEAVLAQITKQTYGDSKSVNYYSQLLIKSRHPQSLARQIKRLPTASGFVGIENVAENDKKNRQYMLLIEIFCYGFVAIIVLICIANIVNTISTSFALRRREFATLQSIGMTPGSFMKMIHYETLLYGIKSLLYGLPLSFGLLFMFYKLTSDSVKLPVVIPWNSIIAVILGVSTVLGLTMLYASAKLKRQNSIEALKNENI